MNTSINTHDSLEQLIYHEGLRIQAIDVHKDMDLIVVILNTGSVLRENISKYTRLKDATPQMLLNYTLTAKGTGIHWPDVDEDLSLKGLLRDTIKSQVMGGKVA
ncbi:MAG: DUF2442 domain-containing protein [Bacteroidota bacterium]